MNTSVITLEERIAYNKVRRALKNERKEKMREFMSKAIWKLVGVAMIIIGLVVATKITTDDAGGLLLMILGLAFVFVPKHILFGEDDYYDM